MRNSLSPCGLITLTTDFGTRDPYVAAMKAVLIGACPAARVVDLSHDVPAYDWRGAAYVLGACHADFPRGSVHVVVVDPGVGSARRALCVVTARGWFVGPDNGCLDDAVRDAGFRAAFRIARSPRPVSATFHGRDLFAPVAGRLAAGQDPRALLEPTDWRPRLRALSARRRAGALVGQVVWVDRFGNLITTVRRADLPRARAVTGHVGDQRVERLLRTYADARDTAPFFLWGSSGRLEVSVREGSAAERLGVGSGCAVSVRAGR